MRTDQTFRDEVGAAGSDEARLGVITAAGFDVVAADKSALTKALQGSDGEVSDAQLEGVSGAGCNVPNGGLPNWPPEGLL
jgi:predicted ribosomally synthesized peptide with nif11-like leader